MANLIEIDKKDLDRLNMNMGRFTKELQAVCKEALKNLGAKIIAEAQVRLSRNKNVGTGLLINSGAVKEGRDNAILAGFPTIYAYYVEFGRKAGKYPPFRYIYQWVKVKHFAEDEQKAKSIAFAIQRSIGTKGTRPHPFLKPAYEQNKPLLQQVLIAGAKKIMNKDFTQ